jgi:thiol-disulfide isomerase/thioredoxin
MHRTSVALIAAFLLAGAGAPALAQPTAAAASQAQPAAEMLEAIDAVEIPQYDRARADEEGYIDEYLEARKAAYRKQGELVMALYKAYPDDPALADLLPRHWTNMVNIVGEPDAILAETELVMAKSKGTPLAVEAAYARANARANSRSFDMTAFNQAFDAFAALAPDDDRGSRLLMTAARSQTGDAAVALYKRIVAAYPDSSSAGYAKGKIRQVEQLNKPFVLTFSEATTGETIDMKDLRGKVVVIDFWATWCGPCIGEMPHMKELYAEYKPKGVEFIGVSLDQPEDKGGLEKLRAYVAENEIAWPQYYQGNYWQSEFSTGWGINSIPCLFIIDKQGNLHSTSARGQLETLIPKLLGEDRGAG